MDVSVQEADTVVHEVPEVILRVKQDHSGVLLPAKFPHSGCHPWEFRVWGPHPLRDRHGQDIQNLVPPSQDHRLPNSRLRHLLVRLDLVFLDPFPVLAPKVNDNPGRDAQEVQQNGRYDRKQWRPDVLLPQEESVPDRLQYPEDIRFPVEPRQLLDTEQIADILEAPESKESASVHPGGLQSTSKQKLAPPADASTRHSIMTPGRRPKTSYVHVFPDENQLGVTAPRRQ